MLCSNEGFEICLPFPSYEIGLYLFSDSWRTSKSTPRRRHKMARSAWSFEKLQQGNIGSPPRLWSVVPPRGEIFNMEDAAELYSLATWQTRMWQNHPLVYHHWRSKEKQCLLSDPSVLLLRFYRYLQAVLRKCDSFPHKSTILQKWVRTTAVRFALFLLPRGERAAKSRITTYDFTGHDQGGWWSMGHPRRARRMSNTERI